MKICETCIHCGEQINSDMYWCESGKTCVNGSAWECKDYEQLHIKEYITLKQAKDSIRQLQLDAFDCMVAASPMFGGQSWFSGQVTAFNLALEILYKVKEEEHV